MSEEKVKLLEEELKQEKIITGQLDNKLIEIRDSFSKYQTECNLYIQKQQVDFNEKYMALGNEYSKTKKEYEDLYNYNKTVKLELNKSENERDILVSKNRELVNKLETINESNSELEDANKKTVQFLTDEIDKLKKEYESEKESQSILFKKLTLERDDLTSELNKLKLQNEKTNEKVSEKDLLESEIKKLKKVNEELEITIHNINKEVDISKLEILNLKNKNEDLIIKNKKDNEAKNLELNSKDVSLIENKEHEEIKTKYNKLLIDLSNIEELLSKQIKENKEIKEIKEKYESKEKEYVKENNEIKESKEKLENLLRNKQNECEELTKQIDILQTKISLLSIQTQPKSNNDDDNNNIKIKNLEGTISKLIKDNKETKESLQSLQNILNKKQSEIEELTSQLIKKQKESDDLANQLNKKQTDIDDLSNQLNLLKNKVDNSSKTDSNQNKIMIENMAKQENYFKNLLTEKEKKYSDEKNNIEAKLNLVVAKEKELEKTNINLNLKFNTLMEELAAYQKKSVMFRPKNQGK